jgi:hypothetical protein
MLTYLLVAAVVFGINLMPALGPPTWTVLVLFRLHEHLSAPLLIVIGALAAGAGRLCLAVGTRHVGRWLPDHRVASLRAAGDYLTGHRGRAAVGLGLFALSPLPSAQLFEAAGVMKVPLLPITTAFFGGRLVSYSLYIGAAGVADASLGGQLQKSITSWPSITLQAVMLVGVVLLARVDWAKRLPARSAHAEPALVGGPPEML